MNNHHQILTDLKTHLQLHQQNTVKDLILFGSQAYGGANKDSDYDVLIVLKQSYTSKDEDKILDLCYDIDLKYGILIDAHLLSVEELDSPRGRQPIFRNALNTGIYA
jgi:predicted nucleotidyltransferase